MNQNQTTLANFFGGKSNSVNSKKRNHDEISKDDNKISSDETNQIWLALKSDEWLKIMKPWFADFCDLDRFLISEYQTKRIFPPKELIFESFRLCPPNMVKVVIIGQDPYHQPGQANGFCFSVKKNIQTPPSLVNIYKLLKNDYPLFEIPRHGDLTKWAENGVLLLNTCLTVEHSKPNSHSGKGWEKFTDKVISHLCTLDQPIVFMLWGNNAKAKEPLIKSSTEFILKPKRLILKAPHPSPLSTNEKNPTFYECQHFKRANEFLLKNNQSEINFVDL
jgi:uracil-DNA glycosylase